MNMQETDLPHPEGILLFGANGAGKTTLGRALADALDFFHMDHEDYHFIKTEVPYTTARPREACLSAMLADIQRYRRFVLSAVTGDFGDTIPQFYKLAVWITVPDELRMARIQKREEARHGARIQRGGDMHARHQAFMNFAATRPLSKITQYTQTLHCPIFQIDGTMPLDQNIVHITAHYPI